VPSGGGLLSVPGGASRKAFILTRRGRDHILGALKEMGP
jgi:hypothetical protein